MRNDSMRIPGKRVKQTRLVLKGNYVVSAEVGAVIPPDDPSEPCYESETVNFLKRLPKEQNRMIEIGCFNIEKSTSW